MPYATEADLAAVLGSVPASASVLLTRASRDVDTALLCAVYDPADPDTVAALRDAVVEQVAGMIAAGDPKGLGGRRSGFSIGGISYQASAESGPQKIGRLYTQAYAVLQAAGLTGYGPQDI